MTFRQRASLLATLSALSVVVAACSGSSSAGTKPATTRTPGFLRDSHYYHGGVANAPAYQMEISAFGYFPGDTDLSRGYPWLGFRIGVIGTP